MVFQSNEADVLREVNAFIGGCLVLHTIRGPVSLAASYLRSFATILISVIPLVGINRETWIAVHAGKGGFT
jgi:hypothetical protein